MVAHDIYYIRLLKTPPSVVKSGCKFTIAWTISNDLGDQTFWQPLSITCRITHNLAILKWYDKAGNLLNQGQRLEFLFDPVKGGGTMSAMLAIESAAPLDNARLVFGYAESNVSHPIWQGAHLTPPGDEQSWIVPVSTLPVGISQIEPSSKTSTGVFERRLMVDDEQLVCIHESAHNSIAGHVWDCALNLCQFLATHNLDHVKTDTLLELGSGTGLAAIYAARMLEPKRVYLTDLPDVVPIMQENADLQRFAKRTKVMVEPLAWGEESHLATDLILLTDILYNQSSHDILLTTLTSLLDYNPHAKILLAYKQRHPDERSFFEKIKMLNWHCDKVEDDTLSCGIYWLYR